jgi:hypothetical protein
MHALQDERVAAETTSRDRSIDRWLVVSEPIAIDDDPDWYDRRESIAWEYEPAA